MKITHAHRAHATLSPSKADMWMTCTASIDLIKKVKPIDKSGPAAEEGTAAHELLETAWRAKKNPENFLGKKFNRVWPATRDMVEAVQVAYDFALSLELDGWTIYSEQKNPISCTGEGGTVDLAAIKKTKRGYKIKIIDYKHGRGIPVGAKENRQMRLYAIGLIEAKKITFAEIDEIELVIIQPRGQREPQTWMDSARGLKKFYDEVTCIRDKISSGDVSFNPNEKACMWCPVKNNCKAFAAKAIADAQLDFKDVTSTQITKTKKDVVKETTAIVRAMSPEETIALAKNIPFIEMWLRAFYSHLFDLASNGKLKGFKVVQGDANRKWSDEEKVIAALHKMKFNVDDFMPRQLLGLTKIGELFDDKKKRETFITKHTTRPDGKPVMVPDSDPRPSINPADDFAGI
jgi:hypothetical protein